MTNWNIIGHEWAIDFFQRSMANKRMAHAYLISGPAGVGKALVALRLAQVLNCESGGISPCLECRTCKRIERGNHPDVRIAGMATQTHGMKPEEAARQRDLKIDTVRDWQRDINLRPYEGQQRIFILHDAERLNESASNAILKTLEEPPPYATLILVANTSGDLLPTIVSRCQPLKLRLVPRVQITSALSEQLNVAAEDAELLAAWSNGRIGWALRMLNNPDELETRQTKLDELLSLATQPRSTTFGWAEGYAKAYRGGEQLAVFEMLELWQSWWRDILLMSTGCTTQIVHVDRRPELSQAVSQYHLVDIHAFIARLTSAAQQLRENVNPQLALENVLLHMPIVERR